MKWTNIEPLRGQNFGRTTGEQDNLNIIPRIRQ
jgi:hypothetical protein